MGGKVSEAYRASGKRPSVMVFPMPREMAESHLLRIQIVNGLTSRTEVIRLLQMESSGPNIPLLNHLADHCSMDQLEYATCHSFLPINGISARPIHGQVTFSNRKEMTIPVNQPRFCRKCIANDLELHGFSWYRREHHLIGLSWCTEHKDPLWWSSENPRFDTLPHCLLNTQNIQVAPELLIDCEKHQFVQRYNRILMQFLEFKSPLNSEELHLSLRSKAIEKGIRVSITGSSYCASDVIKEIAPSSWIAHHFPKLLRKKDKKIFTPIDGLLFPSSFPGTAFNSHLCNCNFPQRLRPKCKEKSQNGMIKNNLVRAISGTI